MSEFGHRMTQDREHLDALEAIYLDLHGGRPLVDAEEYAERVAIVHRRLKAQFIERYGERP